MSHELHTPLAFICSQAELIAGADATQIPLEEVIGDAGVLAQWIAHAHRGTITVHSVLGEGSVFTIMLPLVTDRSYNTG